jgi:hypothetical protein
LKADLKIGRAEALRHSMLAMMTEGKDYEAHRATRSQPLLSDFVCAAIA